MRTIIDHGQPYVEIYVAYVTVKGRRIWARDYGWKAFRLLIPAYKYRPYRDDIRMA